MPRIDPQQLLKCLSVLLSPKGGIKSKDEVQRLASLMTKFSKKLVSKCIYVSILKATETDLLIMFMSAGGWDLTFTWLSDGVGAKNWPLVTELVELLLICPVDIDRLKTNACPKLIKTLSKDSTADENVRLLACKLVEQWLRVVRGDNEPTQPSATDAQPQPDTDTDSAVQQDGGSEGQLPVYKITIRDGEKVLAKISGGRSSTEATEEECGTPTSSDDVNQEEEEHTEVDANDDDDDDEDEEIKPVKLKKKPQIRAKQVKKPAKVSGGVKKERDSTDSASSVSGKSNKLKESAKAGKKEKVESPKVKSTLKSKGSSPKAAKEGVNPENNVGSMKKPDESLSNLKHRAKLSLSLKNKKSTVPIKDKKEIKNEKIDSKEKNILDEDDSLTEKEKESLKKLIAPPISKLGKIPKKTSSNKEEKQSEEKNRTLKEENSDAKVDGKKGYDIKKPEVKRQEKNFSIGVDRKAVEKGEKPKTVKTYNSKFRSTGLEEEVKPPPPRPAHKKPPPPLFPPALTLPEKKSAKRMSPPPEPHLPEKKLKPESPQDDKKLPEKAGGIKLIPPKPKPMFLQESDVFMDAMLAANTMKEPRKRKRKPSVSREGPSDPKKEAQDHKNNSPSNSPKSEDSPSSVKPTFKFYQDTLETSMEEEKADKAEDENLEFAEPDRSSDDLGDDQKSMSSTEDEKVTVRVGQNGPLKGVLVHLKSRRQKKSVTWKEDGLETVKFFELDETERVNVTKNFSDMKLMEREHERENFQLVRKLAVDDIMEEKTRWRALIPTDIAAPVVAPGKNSQEKEIQYAREKTVPAAVYFNKRTIPDTPAEPDLEIHATTDPAIIPLDDITGSTDSINDFTTTPWPEPKGPAPPPVPPPAPPAAQPPAAPFPAVPAPGPAFPGPFPPMGPPGAPFMPPGPPMGPNSDCWRTGDGKVVPMPEGMMMGPPQPMMGPPGPMGPMGPPGPMMLPPGVGPEMGPFPMMGPAPPMPEEMHFPGGFPQMAPGPFPPGPPVPQGPPQGWQGGGNWYDGDQQQGPPPQSHHNQNRSNSNWRGRGGRNPDGNWGGNNSRMPICNNIIKKGFCRNNSCRFRHPRN